MLRLFELKFAFLDNAFVGIEEGKATGKKAIALSEGW
jgi:hypothetical protein